MHAATTITALPQPARQNSEPPVPVRMEFLDGSRRNEAMTLWRDLEARLPTRRLTCSFLWTNTWLTHYGLRVPHQFALGRRGDELIGLCLVTESLDAPYGPLAIRTAHIGTAGERDEDSVCVEHNTLLVRSEDQPDFNTSLKRALMLQGRYDAVAWDGFDPLDLPQESTASPGWQVVVKPTFYFDLNKARESGVEPITLLGNSTRKGIRQNLRDVGAVQVDWSETADEAEASLAELVQMHQARWKSAGEPGAFASPAFQGFHREMVRQLAPLGLAAVVRVRAGQVVIGSILIYFDQNRALVYQAGWSATHPAGKSLGLISDYCCLCECLRRGFDAYDFMAGDSIHKRRMTTDQGRLAWAVSRKASWKFQAVERLRSAKRFWRSLFQKSAVPNSSLRPAENSSAQASPPEVLP